MRVTSHLTTRVARRSSVHNLCKIQSPPLSSFHLSLSLRSAFYFLCPRSLCLFLFAFPCSSQVDLGVQIDGFVAVVAQTFAVPAKAGSAQTTPITGRAADAYAAALVAADAAFKLLRVGRKNTEITEMIQKVAAEYNVSPVQGVLSHSMPRNKIDGSKVILNRLDPEQRVEEVTFGADEVYGIDIVMSTGEGKPKETDNRQTTIYKRNAAVTYSLKSNTARNIFKEIIDKHSAFPFSLRYLSDAGKARFGIAEAREHDLVHAYPVLHEKVTQTLRACARACTHVAAVVLTCFLSFSLLSAFGLF